MKALSHVECQAVRAELEAKRRSPPVVNGQLRLVRGYGPSLLDLRRSGTVETPRRRPGSRECVADPFFPPLAVNVVILGGVPSSLAPEGAVRNGRGGVLHEQETSGQRPIDRVGAAAGKRTMFAPRCEVQVRSCEAAPRWTRPGLPGLWSMFAKDRRLKSETRRGASASRRAATGRFCVCVAFTGR